MAQIFTGQSWSLTTHQDWIDVTSDRPSPDERWRFTDPNEHEHFYEHGYPTLDEVIDAQHWCDGTEGIYNHDPHMAIDASHYECKICRVVIKPAMDPPNTHKVIPGMRSASLAGQRGDGSTIEMWVTPDEVDQIRASESAAQWILDHATDDRVYSVTFTSR